MEIQTWYFKFRFALAKVGHGISLVNQYLNCSDLAFFETDIGGCFFVIDKLIESNTFKYLSKKMVTKDLKNFNDLYEKIQQIEVDEALNSNIEFVKLMVNLESSTRRLINLSSYYLDHFELSSD